jgi:phosphocarrier protein
MQTATTTIRNQTGLHARPASDFVAMAKSFESKITVKSPDAEADEAVNAKSIILLLARGFEQGEQIQIIAEGADEAAAVAGLVELIDSGFGE